MLFHDRHSISLLIKWQKKWNEMKWNKVDDDDENIKINKFFPDYSRLRNNDDDDDDGWWWLWWPG